MSIALGDSYIPFELPIQQISGPQGIGRISFTNSSGILRFIQPDGELETGGLTQTRKGAAVILAVNIQTILRMSFDNRDMYCTNSATNYTYFYVFLSVKVL